MQAQETKQNITVLQSQCLVQELIEISLHCIAFLRNIFDDNNFTDKSFVTNPHIKVKGKYVKYKSLIKGTCKEADTFINWIHDGINDAINLKYLRAVQFSIYLDESNPQRLTECYLFEINYDSKDISVSVNNKLDGVLTNLSAREKVQQLIKRLIVLTQTFNPLPLEKYVSIRLLYNDSCPKDYQPTYFKDASNLNIPTIEIEKRNRGVTDEIGTVDMGFNSVDIKIVTNYGKEIKNPISLDPFDLVFGQLAYGSRVSRDSNIQSDENALSLNKFLDSKIRLVESTQILPDTFENEVKECECGASDFSSISKMSCEICLRKVHACCYGLVSSVKGMKCYTCMLDEVDDSLLSLMRTRFLWKYFTVYGIPEFTHLFRLFSLDLNVDYDVILKILNKFFKDNILINSGNPILKKNGEFVLGCGYLTPTCSGIVDNFGKSMKVNEKYSIAFVPRVKPYFKSLDYNHAAKSMYFPRTVKGIDSVRNTINNFKIAEKNYTKSKHSDFPTSYDFNSEARPSLHNSSVLHMNSTIDEIDSLSFEDSLTFLSQSQTSAGSNKRQNDEELMPIKSRKVSINIDNLF